jgi:putative ABC transport system permease protein
MWSLVIRNLTRHRARSAVTLAAIAFGVAGLIVSGGFVRDVFVKLGESLIRSQSGHLQVFKAGFFESGSRFPEKFLMDAGAETRQVISAETGVAEVMARVRFSGLISNGRSDWAILGEGIEAAQEARLSTHLRILSGRQLDDRDRFGLLVGEGVALALELRPGDPVTLVATTSGGALNSLDFEVTGVFRSFSRDFDARAVRMPLQAAQSLLNDDRVNAFVVMLGRTADTDAAVQALRSRLDPARHEVKSWVELNDFYEKTVALYERQFAVLQTIILVMVVLSVANSVNMSVFERVAEFGTQMAVGTPPGRVGRQIVLEGVALGLTGATAGVALGLAAAAAISAIGIPMPPPPNANSGYLAHIDVVPVDVAKAFLVGLLAATAASLIPARRVARTPVAAALREAR